MNLSPTDEQRALRDAAREFLAAKAPIDVVGALMDREPGWDPSTWSLVAELGWTGVSVPDALGGIGLGMAEEVILAEETAAALLPVPLLSTVGLALPALLGTDSEDATVAAIAAGTLRATLAWAPPSGSAALSDAASAGGATASPSDGGCWSVTGTRTWVPDADRVDILVVVASTPDGPVILRCDADAAKVRRLETIDPSRPLCEVRFESAPARLVAGPDEAAERLDRVRTRALTLAAAEAVGVAARVLELSVAYASQRKQFGRLIGMYQAVSHQLADTYVDLELSRSLVLWAALSIDAGLPEAAAAVTAAAAAGIPRAVTACERAIQVHGGIGTTWESPLHRYYKRAIALGSLDGSPLRQRARLWKALQSGEIAV